MNYNLWCASWLAMEKLFLVTLIFFQSTLQSRFTIGCGTLIYVLLRSTHKKGGLGGSLVGFYGVDEPVISI